MSFKAVTIQAYGKTCHGCVKSDTAIMISFQRESGGEVTDMFLDAKQAEKFYKQLGECLERNKRDQE